jgi:hypothetical protein
MRCRVSGLNALVFVVAIGLDAACADSGDDAGKDSGASSTTLAAAVVSAETDGDIYTAGEMGTATFEILTQRSVYLPGCAPFVFEQSLDQKWIVIGPPFVCVWEGLAVAVATNEIVETQFDAPRDTGIYRLRYDYSMGCEPNRPLSQANCSSEAVAYSNEFEVARELCDPVEFGCRFMPAAPNFLCADGVNLGGPAGECTRNPVSGECGYEFLSCP